MKYRHSKEFAGNHGNYQNLWGSSKKKFMKIEIQNGQNLPIFNTFSQRFHRLVLGLIGQIDEKGIAVAQPLWLSGCPT